MLGTNFWEIKKNTINLLSAEFVHRVKLAADDILIFFFLIFFLK